MLFCPRACKPKRFGVPSHCRQVDRESRIHLATNEKRTQRSVSPSTSITFRNPFRMNTCKSLSKQTTLTIFRMNTYEKPKGRGTKKVNSKRPVVAVNDGTSQPLSISVER